MTKAMAVVPARGGSKSIPNKNLRELDGVPLVVHAIRQAFAAQAVDRVLVSTDSKEIAEVARQAGAEVPFIRPAEFATDAATDLDVFAHLLDFLASTEGTLPDLLVQVRPTSPIRRSETIDLAVRKMLARRDATSLRSISPTTFPPYKMWLIDGSTRLHPVASVPGMTDWFDRPRQALPDTYAQDGLVDVVRPQTILEHGSMAGPIILGLLHPERAVDIDSMEDLVRAEQIMRESLMPNNGRPRIGILQGRLSASWNGELQCFPRGVWRDEFTTAAEVGIDAIEVIVDDLDAENPMLSEHGATALAAESARRGVALDAACFDYVIRHPLAESSTLHWIESFGPRLEMLGCRLAVLPLFGASDPSDQLSAESLIPALRYVADVFARYGVKTCLEATLPGDDLYEYLGRLGRDSIGICYDLGNTTALGHDTVADIALLGSRIWHVHVKDKNNRGENVPLGSGIANLDGMVSALAATGFRTMSLETPRGDDARGAARTHLALVHALITEK